jgi:hypothetical protein
MSKIKRHLHTFIFVLSTARGGRRSRRMYKILLLRGENFSECGILIARLASFRLVNFVVYFLLGCGFVDKNARMTLLAFITV